MEAPGEVEARAGIRGNRSLRLHVLEGFAEHVHFGAGGGLECCNHGVEGLVLRRHETLPSHYGQLGAAFGLPWRALRPSLCELQQSGPGERAGRRQRGTALKKRTASTVMHSLYSLYSLS